MSTELAPFQARPTPIPLLARPGRAGRLPVPLSTLVGRERDIAAVAALVLDPAVRLVTLTGPGGVGKTRLGLAVAAEVEDDFADGVAFVELAAIRDPALVVPAIAHASGLRPRGDQPAEAALQAFLYDKDLLLVLDNFEQVVTAGPRLAELLQACPRLTALVTSRALLHVSGERAAPVSPLLLPRRDDGEASRRAGTDSPIDSTAPRLLDSEAVRLFVERTRQVRPDFELTDANAAAVAEVCRRLDGLPLAIELAAVRGRLFPPAALLARLEPRLPQLTGGPRDLPARHQTMRDAIAWSHDLLTPEEQVVFRRLGAFAGGAPLDAVDTVCAADSVPDPLAAVTSLVGQSLVQAAEAPPGHPRITMLEIVREYALTQMQASGDEASARQAHAAYYADLAERLNVSENLTDQAGSLARFKVEHANLRAALSWLWDQGPAGEVAYCRLCEHAFSFWWARGHIQEALDWVDRALTVTVPPPERASILRAASYLRLARGDLDLAEALAREAVETASAVGLHSVHAYALYALGWVAEITGDIGMAVSYYEEGLAVAGTAPTPLPFAVGLLKEALAVCALSDGDLDRAEALAREALADLAPLGERLAAGLASSILGWVRYQTGDVAGALVAWGEAFRAAREVDDPQQMGVGLAAFGRAALDAGQPELAARWLGAADALRERAGRRQMENFQQFEQSAVLARARLTPKQFDASWRAGGGLALDDVWAEIEDAELGRMLSAPLTVPVSLTPREAELLPLIAAGLTNREIAEALYLSVRTVERHMAGLFATLDVHSRADAVEVARNAGVLPATAAEAAADTDSATGA